jgi:hypothetical protein
MEAGRGLTSASIDSARWLDSGLKPAPEISNPGIAGLTEGAKDLMMLRPGSNAQSFLR